MKLKTYLICRIVFTTLFLILSTTIWFTRKVNVYHDVKTNIQSNEIVFSDVSKNDDTIYHLKLENKEDNKQKVKVYIIPDIMKNNIDNNYIKYQINNNDIKTLNMDGMIIVDTIDSLEEKNIDLKVWVSDTYNGDLSYSGRVVVA